MKSFVSLFLIGSLGLVALPTVAQQQMDSAAKKKVIKELDALLALNRSAETKVINTAISKLSSASHDPSAAYDLLVQSKKILMDTEKEKDKAQGKSAKNASNSMKDWMDREAKKYQDKNSRKGLMLQYQWGILVLKARLKENMAGAIGDGNGEIDVTEFQKPAMELLNAYLAACQDTDFMDPSSSSKKDDTPSRPGAQIAEQSVLSSEVGEALGIASMGAKSLPDSLKNRDEIFDKLFFTPYRRARNLSALRQAWQKRIDMEINLSKISHALSLGKKSGMQGRIANTTEDSFDDNNLAILDSLRWKCELDCFDLGDHVIATRNMMNLIKNTKDPVRREQGIRTLRDRLIRSLQSKKSDSDNATTASNSDSDDDTADNVSAERLDTKQKPSKTKKKPAPKPAADEEESDDTPAPVAEPEQETKTPPTPKAKGKSKPARQNIEDDFFKDA